MAVVALWAGDGNPTTGAITRSITVLQTRRMTEWTHMINVLYLSPFPLL